MTNVQDAPASTGRANEGGPAGQGGPTRAEEAAIRAADAAARAAEAAAKAAEAAEKAAKAAEAAEAAEKAAKLAEAAEAAAKAAEAAEASKEATAASEKAAAAAKAGEPEKAEAAAVEAETAAAQAEENAGIKPARDITQDAAIQGESGETKHLTIDGKSYLFTPTDTTTSSTRSSTTTGEDTGSESVLLNGQAGVITPIPDDGSVDTTSSTFAAQEPNSFSTDREAVHELWSLVQDSDLRSQGPNADGVSLIGPNGEMRIEESNLTPEQKVRATELFEQVKQQVWDEATYMLFDGMPDSVEATVGQHVNLNDHLYVGTFSFNNIHNREGTTNGNIIPANDWHYDDAFINSVTALDPSVVSPDGSHTQEQTQVMPWQSSSNSPGYEHGSIQTPPDDQTTMFYGLRAEDDIFAPPLLHKVPDTTNPDRWVITASISRNPDFQSTQTLERLGVLRLAHESGAFKNNPEHLNQLANDLFTPKANGKGFENGIKTALAGSFPDEAAKQQFVEHIQKTPEHYDPEWRKEHGYNAPPTRMRENLTKWADEWSNPSASNAPSNSLGIGDPEIISDADAVEPTDSTTTTEEPARTGGLPPDITLDTFVENYTEPTTVESGTSVYRIDKPNVLDDLVGSSIPKDGDTPGSTGFQSTDNAWGGGLLGPGVYTYTNKESTYKWGNVNTDPVFEYETQTDLNGVEYENAETNGWINNTFSIDELKNKDNLDFIQTTYPTDPETGANTEVKFHDPAKDLVVKNITIGESSIFGRDDSVLVRDKNGDYRLNPNFDQDGDDYVGQAYYDKYEAQGLPVGDGLGVGNPQVIEPLPDDDGTTSQNQQYNDEGKLTYEETYNPADNTTTANHYIYDSAGKIEVQGQVVSNDQNQTISSGRTEYNEQGTKVSSEQSTFDPATGNRESLTETTYDAEGNAAASTQSAYDAAGALTSEKQYDGAGTFTSEKQYTYYDGGKLATETELDATGNKLSEKNHAYNSDGSIGFTNTDTYNTEGNIASSESQSFDTEGTLVSSGSATYDAAGNLASSTEATYDAAGSVTSTTNYTFAPEGHILNEVALANGVETMSTYDTMGALTATGPSVNGQWNGGVRVFGDDGSLSRVDVYTNGAATGASYDRATNTFTGVNVDGVMSTNDLTNFDSIVNSMRETGSVDFFEHPDNAKYGTLIETLDFVQAAGLPISAIENFDLTKPTEFNLNVDALKAWTDQLDDVDPSARAANSDTAIRDFSRYLDLAKQNGTVVNGARTVGWFLTNVVAGDTGDIASLGKGLYNFAQNFDSSKIFGKTARNVTPDFLNSSISKAAGVSSAGKAFSAAKFLGPVAAVISVGLNLYSGITGYREAKENGASNAELAYWVFTAVGGGPGGGITAAIVAKENGGSPAQVAGAFFAGLFGAYTPGQPLIGSFKADERDRDARLPSRDTLASINIPPNGSDPGFNGSTYDLFDGTSLYGGRHDPVQEDAFYDYMAAYHSDSPNFVPRVPGVNGQYVTSEYFGEGETYFEGEQWVWADGQMPLWGVREGAPSPATSVDDLEIVGWIDHPTPTPELVETPEDEADWDVGDDWGS